MLFFQAWNRKKKIMMVFSYVYKSKLLLMFLDFCGVLMLVSHFAVNAYNGNTIEIHVLKCDFLHRYCMYSES